MSSFINKSGKKVAPKAPARRRPAAPASAAKIISESSARNTAEPSRTPQPEVLSKNVPSQQASTNTEPSQNVTSVAPLVPASEAPVAKPTGPPVLPTGIPDIEDSRIENPQTVPLSMVSSLPTQSRATPAVVASSSVSRPRDESPAGLATTNVRGLKRRRVENVDSTSQAEVLTPVVETLRPSIASSSNPIPNLAISRVGSTSAEEGYSSQVTPGASSATTPAQESESASVQADSSKEKAVLATSLQQLPSRLEVPEAALVGASARTTQPPQQPSSEPIVEYEVPGSSTLDFSHPPLHPPPANDRSHGTRSPTPATTPKPKAKPPSKDRWQVTTLAQVAQKKDRGKPKRAANVGVSSTLPKQRARTSRSKVQKRQPTILIEDDVEDDGEDDEFTTEHSATPAPTRESDGAEQAAAATSASVRRLANAVKRKRKQREKEVALFRASGLATASTIDEAVAATVEGRTSSAPLGQNTAGIVGSENTEADGEGAPKRRKSGTRARRGSTPEENAGVMIVPTMTRMSDLTLDMRVGVKSEREARMRLIDWDEVKQRRREDEIRESRTYREGRGRGTNSYIGSLDDLDEGLDADEIIARMAEKNREARGDQALRLRLVNGEHVIDEATQFIDRHAMNENEKLEDRTVEKDDLTKRFNVASRATWGRKFPEERIKTHEKWPESATDRFYECLSQFGTDFMVISNMFPGRTRRHIKAKFVKEERADPERIKQALDGHLTRKNAGEGWDLGVYAAGANKTESEFLDPEVIYEELRVKEEAANIEIEDARAARAQEIHNRKLAGWYSEDEADENGEPLPDSEVKKRRAAKAKKARAEKRAKKLAKRMGPPTGGDEEVVETIEGEED